MARNSVADSPLREKRYSVLRSLTATMEIVAGGFHHERFIDLTG
jgi:hypothetical protein